VPGVHEQAEAAVALSTEQGFPLWVAWGTSLRGWALAMQDQSEEGLAQVRQGIAVCRATGAALVVPFFYTMGLQALSSENLLSVLRATFECRDTIRV
jgi:hypothetical protein